MTRLQSCPCGSGQYPAAQHDARGIFLCYTCEKCEDTKLSQYRKDVLTDPNYWHDEDIGETEEQDYAESN